MLEWLDRKTGLILTRDHTEDLRIGDRRILVRPAWRFFLSPLTEQAIF